MLDTKAILDHTYTNFGENIPSRQMFGAYRNNVISIAMVRKHFGNWNKFIEAYKEHVLEQKAPVKQEIVFPKKEQELEDE